MRGEIEASKATSCFVGMNEKGQSYASGNGGTDPGLSGQSDGAKQD